MLASRDRWTREELLAYQSHALAELRALALARSPFYREFHRRLDTAPLESLPVLTKATLMERFDDLVTDRDVRLSEVEAHLTSTGSTDLLAQPTDGVVDADVATSVRVALRQGGSR